MMATLGFPRPAGRQRGAVRHVVAVAVLALAAAVGGWMWFAPAERAPDVAFSVIDGRKLGTQDLRGKVVLVNFWATSCVTCVKKMPMITESYETFRDRGYEVVAVAMSYDPANYVLNFVETRKLPFTVALDPMGETARAFGDVRLTPTSFLVDREGRIVKRYLGDVDQARFFADIEAGSGILSRRARALARARYSAACPAAALEAGIGPQTAID